MSVLEPTPPADGGPVLPDLPDIADLRLVSVDVLADLLGVSVRTLHRRLSAGELPEPIRFGGVVRWRLAEVRRWIAAGCPACEAEGETKETHPRKGA